MSATYGSIPPSEETVERLDTRTHFLVPTGVGSNHNFTKWVLNYLKGGDLRESHKRIMRERKPVAMPSDVLDIHAESVRQIAYVMFWIMIFCAHTFSYLFVPTETIEDSDLKKMFGYNNICVYWDYSPSREFTAMVYPAFEYSFFLYIVFDFIHLRLACKSGGVPGAAHWLYYIVSRITFPLKLILIAMFRMIFVYTVYQDADGIGEDQVGRVGRPVGVRGVVGHTMAFFCMQTGLFLVALENILYINLTNIEYPLLGKKGTKIGSWLYLILFISNTIFQVIFASSIFWGETPVLKVTGPDRSERHVLIIYIVDRMWLILVGIAPLFFAQVGRKTQAHIRVTFELHSQAWEEDPLEEEEELFVDPDAPLVR